MTEAIQALPFHFQSETVIEGVEALDLFSLNSVLGGTIEIQTVETLNRLRSVWDPDGEWADYGFRRFAQAFPDVRLVHHRNVEDPAMGIELKGWYLLAKEAQPSFRYTATKSACSPFDLLVVVPWHLNNVLSGKPIVRAPFIEQAGYAAELRNYYWRYLRGEGRDVRIEIPEDVHPYPPPKTPSSDKAASDKGANFGRVARVQGLMTEFMSESLQAAISGIEARYWIEFFTVFSEDSNISEIEEKMRKLLDRRRSSEAGRSDAIVDHLMEVVRLLASN